MDDDTNNFENCSNCVVDCSCYRNIQIKLKGVQYSGVQSFRGKDNYI